MNKASFSLQKYKFEKIDIDFSKNKSKDLNIAFNPSGKFFSNNSIFELVFEFSAYNDKIEDAFVNIKCIAIFEFQEKISFEEIPTYFYMNSIAIIFPYIRAFVSTITLQANIPPIVLPTMNLSSLEVPLKEQTVKI